MDKMDRSETRRVHDELVVAGDTVALDKKGWQLIQRHWLSAGTEPGGDLGFAFDRLYMSTGGLKAVQYIAAEQATGTLKLSVGRYEAMRVVDGDVRIVDVLIGGRNRTGQIRFVQFRQIGDADGMITLFNPYGLTLEQARKRFPFVSAVEADGRDREWLAFPASALERGE